jgi:hypothetical protein
MCKVMSPDQNAGQYRTINIANKSFENMGRFRYLETRVGNQNSIDDELKGGLNSGNVRCRAHQDRVCSLVSVSKCKD